MLQNRLGGGAEVEEASHLVHPHVAERGHQVPARLGSAEERALRVEALEEKLGEGVSVGLREQGRV